MYWKYLRWAPGRHVHRCRLQVRKMDFGHSITTPACAQIVADIVTGLQQRYDLAATCNVAKLPELVRKA